MLEPMDGCTGIPDVIAGISIRHCCDAHDEALVSTYDLHEFSRANTELAHCIQDAGLWWLGFPALVAVTFAGIWLLYLGPKRRRG